MKLFRLAWDIVGSEFAGRHLQYEKFFPGASFIVRNHNYREAPWGNGMPSSTAFLRGCRRSRFPERRNRDIDPVSLVRRI